MSHAQLSVESLSDLACLPVAELWEGTGCWVETLDDIFDLHRSTNLMPADGITVVQPFVGNPRAGYQSAAWYRRQIQSQRWRWQFNWFLDPATGSDENDGNSAARPLRTYAELQRRVGGTLLLNPDGLDVQVLSDLTEAVSIDMQSPNGVATVYFHAALPAPIYTGTVGAYTDYDPSAGQDGVLTDNGLPASFTASGLIGRLARVTSGPRTGVEFFLAKDLDSKQARTSASLAGTFDATFTAPQAGDAYAVYGDLIKFGANATPMTMEMHGGPGAQMAFQWMELGNPGVHHVEHKGGGLFFSGCVVNGLDVDAGPVDYAELYNTRVVSGCRVNAGGALLVGGMSDGVQARHGARVTAQRAITQDGGWYAHPTGYITSVDWLAAFNAATAMLVGYGALVDLSIARLWGKDISAIGVDVQSAGTVIYNPALPLTQLASPPTQCRVGGVAVNYAALPNVHAANTAKIVAA